MNGQERPREVWEGSGGPPGSLGGVGSDREGPRKFERGREGPGEPTEVRERSGEVGRAPGSLGGVGRAPRCPIGFGMAPRKSGRGQEGTLEVQEGL